jgi:hypothetical protein
MSTTPTGFHWAEAMEPLEARRRVRAVESFAKYLGNDVKGDDPHRTFEVMASLMRRRPWAVSASVLRGAAGRAQKAGGRRR